MFAGQLQVGMEIVQINNMTCNGMDPKMATQILKGLPPGTMMLTATWPQGPSSSSPTPSATAAASSAPSGRVSASSFRPKPDMDDDQPVMPGRPSTSVSFD